MPKQPAKAAPRPSEPDEGFLPSFRDMVIDHGGTELSFELTIAEDGRSFTAVLRDGRRCTTTVSPDGKRRVIEYVYPSVEGNTILCATTKGEEIYFDTETGTELHDVALRERNPHFYT